MSEKLKPCPFCGGEAVVRENVIGGVSRVVMCPGCGAQTTMCLSRMEAVRLWNTRSGGERGAV